MLLSLAAALPSSWPPVQPLGHSHLSSPQKQCCAVFAHWFERGLPSANRPALSPAPLCPTIVSSPVPNLHTSPLSLGMNEGVSMNKM